MTWKIVRRASAGTLLNTAFSDHTEYRVWFVSQGPTPAVCSHEVRRGVTGFGAFCRNKRPVLSQVEGASPAGAKPDNTEHHVDTRVGDTRAMRSPASACLPADPKR